MNVEELDTAAKSLFAVSAPMVAFKASAQK